MTCDLAVIDEMNQILDHQGCGGKLDQLLCGGGDKGKIGERGKTRGNRGGERKEIEEGRGPRQLPTCSDATAAD